MMIRWIAAIALWAGLSSAAVAQVPTSYSLIDSSANHFQVGAFQNSISSKIFPGSVSVDASGNPMAGVAGATNPQSQALYVQGVTNGVPLYVTFPTAQHFICDSGCGGGGGGGLSVPFTGPIGANGTPGGFKDASGNLQPLLGDVTNGEWVLIKNASIAVTGTFFQATQPISAASLPLPTGAATQTTLASILTALGTPLQAGGSVTANAGTNLNTSLLALEGGGNLASINTKTPALGQALAASSVPIVLTALQLTALTPLSTVTVTQGTGTNLHIVCDSGCSGSGGTSSSFGSAFPAAGTAIGMSQGGNMIAMTGTAGNLNVQCANCSGSGASAVDEATMTFGTSVFAPMGGVYQTTATNNPLTTGQQGMAQLTINRAVHMNLRNSTGVEIGTASTPVQVSLANTAANGTALLVTGTGGTFPITAASLPLPTGASTAALQPTNAAQGSTTSGQTGPLMQAAVLTAAPAYTTTQTSPLNMTTGGALRVADASVVTALGTPFQAGGSIGNTTFAATQATAANLNATVVGTGTFAVQATLQASATTAIGKVDPNTIGNWGLAASTQNGTTPTNGALMMGQFNTSPTTITSGNISPIQMTAAGAVKVDASATTQPISVASSAVAPGAYQAGAFVAGAGADGWDVPEGHTTDTACPASGTATVVGCLRSAVNNPVTLGSASGGISTKTLAALTNTAIAVKAAAGQVYSAQCSNSDATHWAYIQIFNVAAASVTMGTTPPTKFVGIPPASNAGFTFSLVGDQYSTAISAGAASTSTGGTAPTTAIDCTVDFL